MTEQEARRNCPKWANESVVKVYGDEDFPRFDDALPKHASPMMRLRFFDAERFKKRYGILLVGAFLFVVYSILLISITHWRDTIAYREYIEQEIASGIEQYKVAQAQEAQASYWLSGDASREAYINQQIEVGARSAGAKEMQSDAQKGGVIMTEIARSLNKGFPDTILGVAEQEGQIPFYSSDNTYTQHDWEIAEKLIRPFLEDGILPNGLTEDYVYAEWTPTDYILRDKWLKDGNAHYLRYQG